jgi:hypothetical protein
MYGIIHTGEKSNFWSSFGSRVGHGPQGPVMRDMHPNRAWPWGAVTCDAALWSKWYSITLLDHK